RPNPPTMMVAPSWMSRIASANDVRTGFMRCPSFRLFHSRVGPNRPPLCAGTAQAVYGLAGPSRSRLRKGGTPLFQLGDGALGQKRLLGSDDHVGGAFPDHFQAFFRGSDERSRDAPGLPDAGESRFHGGPDFGMAELAGISQA